MGARIVEPDRTRIAARGDMMERDEDGELFLIPDGSAEHADACKKYDAGAAKIAPDDESDMGGTATPRTPKPRKKSKKKKKATKKKAKAK